MNSYRVVLNSLGTVFVEADSVVESQDTVTFYRGRHECAQYAMTMVKSYEVAKVSPHSPAVPEREDSQCP